jgi:hypothetical protein
MKTTPKGLCGYVRIKGLGISRSTKGSWSFQGPFVFSSLTDV